MKNFVAGAQSGRKIQSGGCVRFIVRIAVLVSFVFLLP